MPSKKRINQPVAL